MKKINRVISATAIMALTLNGCAAAPQKPSISKDYTLNSFKEVSTWENQEPVIFLLTMQMYSSAGRFQDGVTHFASLREKYPNQPIFEAAEGVLMAKMADDVPLVSRIQWVNRALDKLDHAALSKRTETILLRGLVEAELPFFFFRKDKGIEDLQYSLEKKEDLPFWGSRGIHTGLAKLYLAKGEKEKSEEQRKLAGLDSLDGPALLADGNYSLATGYRWNQPQTVKIGKSLWMLMGYDFANVYVYETSTGLVIVDAGTMPSTGSELKKAIRSISTAPINALIVTHAHWDHIGGIKEIIEPNTQIIARGDFTHELATVNGLAEISKVYFGSKAKSDVYDLVPNRKIQSRSTVIFGDKKLELIPISSSETEDALIVYDPESRFAIIGDILMPYFGAPFAAEGNPEVMLKTIEELRVIGPKFLLQGHPPLTLYYNMESLDGLYEALKVSLPEIRSLISKGRSESEILNQLSVPKELKNYPKAVLPYLAMREGLIQREFRLRTGYWLPEFQGLDPHSETELASAIDFVGGQSSSSFASAVEALLDRGDISLAARMAHLGLLKYPNDSKLQSLFKKSVGTNQVRNEMINAFKFLMYSNMGQVEVNPTLDSKPAQKAHGGQQ